MIEIELADYNQKVQKLIDHFDLHIERKLDFDIVISFRGPNDNYDEGKNLKDLLDELIESESGWDKISASCRRMIICDRELDLEKGQKILANSLLFLTNSYPLFKNLLTISDDQFNISKEVTEKIINEYKKEIYEITRYVNTCGLISYRSGDYSKALKFFELAECISRNPNSSLSHFIPDTTSNRIRTKFEFFSQVLPDQISEDYVSMYGEKLIHFIKSYRKQIRECTDYSFEKDRELANWIYGHGMASLYHNLAIAYSTVSKLYDSIKDRDLLRKIFEKCASETDNLSLQNRLKNEDLGTIFKYYSKKANNSSLDYGSKVEDSYRQLQSKNVLRRLGDEEYKEKYKEDILAGKWERGKIMVCQDEIRATQKLEDDKKIEEIQKIIDKGKKYFKVEGSGDTISMLYNLNSIQAALKKDSNPPDGDGKEFSPLITIGGKEFTPLDLAYSKIKIAEKLRGVFSAVLYKRQVMKLIREDISLITNEHIKNREYSEALDFSERYANRGLFDLSAVGVSKYNEIIKEKMKAISSLKREIYDIIDLHKGNQLGRNSTRLVLNDEANEELLKLVLAYEDILKDIEISGNTEFLRSQGADFSITSKILTEIEKIENTLIVKFLVFEVNNIVTLRVFLIDKKGVKEPKEINCTDKDYKSFISAVQNALKLYEEEDTSKISDQNVHKEMAKLAKKLNLQENLENVKNIFIIPDGELFQIPLHLLGFDGGDFAIDLRIDYQVYYAPSLLHLIESRANRLTCTKRDDNYLWLYSPTTDLSTLENPLYKPKFNGKKFKLIESKDGTLENFELNFKPNEYTHVGFSTHAYFQNNMATAYVSYLKLYDSFLTTYDILLSMDFSGIETVFLGACSGASSKYTDENEAVGLVTAFLSKGAFSVIAPLCPISFSTHDRFIKLINENNVISNSQSWNLDFLNIFKGLPSIKFSYFVPFVQYTSLDIIKK
ncbi:MAG: CHAT domain-containing protein [Euryarchaeota archaeon]|nr:CHAT domain-containing protein [Euryarchaeota archaeon]